MFMNAFSMSANILGDQIDPCDCGFLVPIAQFLSKI